MTCWRQAQFLRRWPGVAGRASGRVTLPPFLFSLLLGPLGSLRAALFFLQFFGLIPEGVAYRSKLFRNFQLSRFVGQAQAPLALLSEKGLMLHERTTPPSWQHHAAVLIVADLIYV
jgi:hypothetical protein